MLLLTCSCGTTAGGASEPSDGGTPGAGNAGAGGAGTGGASSAPAGAEGGGASLLARCGASPWILSGERLNARSLGGVALAAGATVSCATLYRGPHLSGLSSTGCASFTALGIATVVDLRVPGEQASLPAAPCVSESSTLVAAPLPVPYSVSAADYLADLYSTSSIAQAFHVLGDASAYPVYFHCTYGRDRSGVLAALVLLTLGATRETVMTEYLLSVEGGVGATPESLAAVLDEIEALGGIDAYLALAGVPASDVAVLRALGTAPAPAN